ncbi:Uncharacterized protein dnm_069700 [Desulfonema magnum]|uniref:Uncharacterized protein n=1 Tax=Desulfonema magnum TaxID=45655 RepID=A0A975BSQ1_9BACT|nr:Uncharacterized protein dnm_069700 [Desulfonema magnum]
MFKLREDITKIWQLIAEQSFCNAKAASAEKRHQAGKDKYEER